VSTNGYPPAAATTSQFREHAFEALREQARPRHRYWLHALLFLLTILTTTVVGAELSNSFYDGRPFDLNKDFEGYTRIWHNPLYLIDGLPFSLTLLLILLAHEMGHYLAGRYYGVNVTLPFFIPAPTLIGTLGAFIRIRSPIIARRILFDIGIAGPIAGFITLLVPLVVGISLSKPVAWTVPRGDLIFGTPPILRALEWMIFRHTDTSHLYLHPVARAAWVGLLATALNLLPIGQLDGGHILYSFVGERTKFLSRLFVVALAVLGVTLLFTSAYPAGIMWLLWSVVMFFLGMRHPVIVDPTPLSPVRRWLGLAALIIFLLTFTLAPVQTAAS